LNAPSQKPERPKKTPCWLATGRWIIGTAGLASTLLGLAAAFPRLEITRLDEINSKDQLSFPFELKNAGLFTIKDIAMAWKNFHAEQGESSYTAGTIGNSKAFVKTLRPDEKATVPPPGWVFNTPTWDRATVDIIVSFRYLQKMERRFRFVGRKIEGKLRWYAQPTE